MDEPAIVARGMTRWKYLRTVTRNRLALLRRRLPYIVWYDDELDVGVTLSRYKLNPEGDPIQQLYSDTPAAVESALRDMGITFDTGMGDHGRDWEWDFSLAGPISVRFKSRATRPERRMERLKPKLVYSAKRPGESNNV